MWRIKTGITFQLINKDVLELQLPRMDWLALNGTSYSALVRTAKLVLDDMMEGIL